MYDQMTQVGVDVQYTRDAWLWKLEAIGRDTRIDNFTALVGGFEYTFYGVRDSAADVGVLLELLYEGCEGVDARAFWQDSRYPEQDDDLNGSFLFQPEFYWRSDDGERRFSFVGFARADLQDSKRSHADIREA